MSSPRAAQHDASPRAALAAAVEAVAARATVAVVAAAAAAGAPGCRRPMWTWTCSQDGRSSQVALATARRVASPLRISRGHPHNQRKIDEKSTAINGNQRQPTAINGNQRQSTHLVEDRQFRIRVRRALEADDAQPKLRRMSRDEHSGTRAVAGTRGGLVQGGGGRRAVAGELEP